MITNRYHVYMYATVIYMRLPPIVSKEDGYQVHLPRSSALPDINSPLRPVKIWSEYFATQTCKDNQHEHYLYEKKRERKGMEWKKMVNVCVYHNSSHFELTMKPDVLLVPSFFHFLILFIYFWRDGKEGRKRERSIGGWLPLACLQQGTPPTTQACVLTDNQTGDQLVHRPALSPLRHTS